eukprot:1418425-Rhodomonas_salina.2
MYDYYYRQPTCRKNHGRSDGKIIFGRPCRNSFRWHAADPTVSGCCVRKLTAREKTTETLRDRTCDVLEVATSLYWHTAYLGTRHHCSAGYRGGIDKSTGRWIQVGGRRPSTARCGWCGSWNT